MIDADSPPGSCRSALEPDRSCAVCKQSVCHHSDLEWSGMIPPRADAAAS